MIELTYDEFIEQAPHLKRIPKAQVLLTDNGDRFIDQVFDLSVSPCGDAVLLTAFTHGVRCSWYHTTSPSRPDGMRVLLEHLPASDARDRLMAQITHRIKNLIASADRLEGEALNQRQKANELQTLISE